MNKTNSAIYPDLKGRSVFISGGATGIGAAIVEAYAKQGAKTAFVDLDEKAGTALAKRLKKDGHEVRFEVCDITNIQDYQSKIRAAADAFGPISVLLNNAANDVRHSLESLTEERFDELVGVNIKHAMFAAQAVAPMMRKLGGGSIINFGSVGWMMATAGYPTYGASKAATHGLTRSLARDLGGAGIRVNTLVPGWVMTEKQKRLWLTPEAEAELMTQQALKEKIEPEDVADLVLFLSADDSRMISGQSLVVDGGRL